MKVAVILTGALRTIKKTIRYLKQNVLLTPDIHVFACVQNDSAESDRDVAIWLQTTIGEHLKHLQWFHLSDYKDWQINRDKLIEHLNITDNWKDYLKRSGSIIEYFQLYLAYIQVCFNEQVNGKYDYIIRSRTDTIFAKPIDFHWLNWSDEDVKARITKIKEELTASEIEVNDKNILRYFMNTIISNDLIPNIQNIFANYYPNRLEIISLDPHNLNGFIKNGKYILTIRANNLYIVKRDYFYLIPSIANLYGYLKSPYSDDYWFNAENQFRAACYHSGLYIFDYNSSYEDKSLYEYDERRYFDLDFNILNPSMLYCLVRN
jgi:hypothetical protein